MHLHAEVIVVVTITTTLRTTFAPISRRKTLQGQAKHCMYAVVLVSVLSQRSPKIWSNLRLKVKHVLIDFALGGARCLCVTSTTHPQNQFQNQVQFGTVRKQSLRESTNRVVCDETVVVNKAIGGIGSVITRTVRLGTFTWGVFGPTLCRDHGLMAVFLVGKARLDFVQPELQRGWNRKLETVSSPLVQAPAQTKSLQLKEPQRRRPVKKSLRAGHGRCPSHRVNAVGA